MGARTAEAPSGVKRRYQLDSGVGRLTPADRAARGKEARAEVPRAITQFAAAYADQNERDHAALVDAWHRDGSPPSATCDARLTRAWRRHGT